jgi:hypothetical protein
MNRSGVCLLVGVLVAAAAPVPGVFAQATVDPKTGLHRIDGTVIAINKEKSTIKIRQKNRSNIVVTVSYTDDTKFSLLNEPATLDDVRDNGRVICVGKLDEEDGRRLVALVVDVRTPRR